MYIFFNVDKRRWLKTKTDKSRADVVVYHIGISIIIIILLLLSCARNPAQMETGYVHSILESDIEPIRIRRLKRIYMYTTVGVQCTHSTSVVYEFTENNLPLGREGGGCHRSEKVAQVVLRLQQYRGASQSVHIRIRTSIKSSSTTIL